MNPWFHRRHDLSPDGEAITVIEPADAARAPYDDLIENLALRAGESDSPPRVLMVVAPRHNDGATTTAVMLAACLASAGRTLLLELNFRRPGLAAALGLTDPVDTVALLGSGDAAALEGAVLRTEVANLFALPLPGGRRLGRPGGNGNGRIMPDTRTIGRAVRGLAEHFDHVVIDAAPVLGYPETVRLATIADGVLLVVAADETPLEEGLAARQSLERGRAPLLGAVVTRQQRYVPDFIMRRLGGEV